MTRFRLFQVTKGQGKIAGICRECAVPICELRHVGGGFGWRILAGEPSCTYEYGLTLYFSATVSLSSHYVLLQAHYRAIKPLQRQRRYEAVAVELYATLYPCIYVSNHFLQSLAVPPMQQPLP